MPFLSYPLSLSGGVSYGQPVGYISFPIAPVFSPLELSPSFYVAPGAYSSSTGVWTASVGANASSYPTELSKLESVNGNPNFPGDVYERSIITPLSGKFSDYFSRGARHLAILISPDGPGAYGVDPAVIYNNSAIVSDFAFFIGLFLRRETDNSKFYVHHYDYVSDSSEVATIDITSTVSASGAGSLFIQGRKTNAGLMQIRVNGSAWVSGGTAPSQDGANEDNNGVSIGLGGYDGIVKTVQTYKRALTDTESNKLYSWAQGYL